MRGRIGVSSDAGERGQTTQDFALGMSLFLIAVTFVFAFIPTVFAFTDTGPGSQEVKQAERSSAALVEQFSIGERRNTFNVSALASYFNTNTPDQLQQDLALPRGSQVNLTIRSFVNDTVVSVGNGSIKMSLGHPYREDRPAAEVVRIITMPKEKVDCKPACRFVVRVW